MKKNEKVMLEKRESEEMLNIIHENHKQSYDKQIKRTKFINKMQNLSIVIFGLIFIVMIIYLTADRKKAIKNCEKNHSTNYCERISG